MEPSDKMRSMFDFLDAKGARNATASAEIVLANGQIMTVRAGGPGVHSVPADPPFIAYEVLLDHDPPPFWSKYGITGSMYDEVPRLLVTHHITRHGGITQLACSDTAPKRTVRVDMSLTVDEDCARAVRQAVEQVASAHLISSMLTFG